MAATQTSFPVVVDEKTVHLDEVKEPIAAHQADCVEDAGKPAAPVLDYAGAARKTNPAEIKLVRKLDFIILPTLWLMYWLNFLDRNAITVARLDGLEKELKLTSGQYQTCISILFVGYILGQVPASTYYGRAQLPLCFQTLTLMLFPRHGHHESAPFSVHGDIHGPLGSGQHPDRDCPQLYWHGPGSFLPRDPRSSFLARGALYAVHILHAEGGGHPHGHSLLGQHLRHGVCRLHRHRHL